MRREPVAVYAAVDAMSDHRAAEPPSAEEAQRFVEAAERRLEELTRRSARASWVQQTHITEDTTEIAALAQAELIAANMELAAQASRYESLELPEQTARKLMLLRLAMTTPAPRNTAAQREQARLTTEMEGIYGRGVYRRGDGECLDANALGEIMAESRDPQELLDAWRGWRGVAPPIRPLYRRFAELGNLGARELGFDDLGALWRSNYDLAPGEFAAEVERLWQQVRPLYQSLHAHVRARLAEHYGPERVPPAGPIPAHLLGNLWGQEWGSLYDLVGPQDSHPGYHLSDLLHAREVDPVGLVRYGERFFTSLGFEPLPETFWRRSLFVKPRDRDVVCHASAWDVNDGEDLRIKMCIEVGAEDFVTVHHELGHNFYQRAYNRCQPFLYRDSANDGFHEAIGDAVALSVTPDYLVEVGLLERVAAANADVGLLLRMALDKVAFLPFGLLVDRWRWKVFSGEISPDDYNAAWWELRLRYQGVSAPLARSERDFDPGAKYHVPSNTPYTRYFLAHVLQFQFHRALCRQAGISGPLHRGSIYGSREAGDRLQAMLAMGRSRPWPEALEAMTGERRMDATALLDYFAPLQRWLDAQNRGRPVGW